MQLIKACSVHGAALIACEIRPGSDCDQWLVTYLRLPESLPANCIESGGLTAEVTEFLPVAQNGCIIARNKS